MRFIPLDAPPDRQALQLVVTLGPASMAAVGDLSRAGATAFRLNASHLDSAELDRALADLKRAAPEAPVVVDLQGAKMRVERREPREIEAGELLCFTGDAGGDVRVPHIEFFRQLRPGDTVSVDDGRLRLAVESVRGTVAHVRALNGGRLLHRKGINVEQHPVRLEGLTERDRQACVVAAAHGVQVFAFSFMSDGRESRWVREQAAGAVVIGKVERREAAEHLPQIAERADAVWICRGDLGAQLGPAELGRFVAAVDPACCPAPMLMAGQVLEHLTGHPEPTRSEVCHLYDLVSRGFAGIVLSDETAVGRDAVHATSIASGLLASFRS